MTKETPDQASLKVLLPGFSPISTLNSEDPPLPKKGRLQNGYMKG